LFGHIITQAREALKGVYPRAGKSEKPGIPDHFCQGTGLGRSKV